MKPFGCTLDFTPERNAALLEAFRREVAAVSSIRLADIGERVVNSPAPRFWVSEERAAIVVSAILRGKPALDAMRPSKREMYQEIHRRVMLLMEERPGSSLCALVAEVVNSPAPKFYMKASSALERLYKIRNGKPGLQHTLRK